MKIDLIHPLLPPALDGIGDYTALMAAELVRQGHTMRVLADLDKAASPIEGVQIVPSYRVREPGSLMQVVDRVRDGKPDWVVLQFNPFGYGRRGYCPDVPKMLAALRQLPDRPGIAVMAHETYAPIFATFKLSVMWLYQRPQFKRVLEMADVVFHSMENRMTQHPTWAPACVRVHLPVGSNIPPVEIEKGAARERLGIAADEIVLGVFGQAHISRLLNLVGDAARKLRASGKKVRLLYIGPDGESFRSELPDIPCTSDGPHPPAEVSRRLRAIDVFLATYVDGICARRGAAIAALQHELPIATTFGSSTDPYLRAADGKAFLGSPVDAALFAERVFTLATDRPLAERMAAGAKQLFDEVFSWPLIARKMADTLQATKIDARTGHRR